MPLPDPVSHAPGGATLLLMAGGASIGRGALDAAAASHGLDGAALRIQSASPFVSLAGRGEASRLATAADALRAGGVSCAAVSESEARALPRIQVAGGVAPDSSGAVLRVHGRPAGPPADVPLLLIFGDLGREDGIPAPSAPRPADTLRQRIHRAVFPVVDVVWSEGRVRVPLRSMAWRGLPGLSPSAPANLMRLLEVLAARSGGTVIDLGFRGQDLAVEAGPSSAERVEGGDAATALLFDRYATAAVLAWKHGLYPGSAPGQVLIPGLPGGPRAPAEIFQARPAVRGESPVPWIRRGKKSRVRGRLWPWFSPAAAVLLFFGVSPAGILILSASGLAAIAVGLRWLAARERIRALALAKIRSAAMGPVQLFGTVVPSAALMSPYSRARAAWYRFEIQERRGDSRNQSWNTVEEGSSGDIPFRLADPTGTILIQPSGAEVDVPTVTTELSPDLRAVEWIIPEGSSLFVSGFAQRRPAGVDGQTPAVSGADADDVFVGSAPGTAFLLSHRSREKETSALTRRFQALLLLGFAYLALALTLWLARPPAGG